MNRGKFRKNESLSLIFRLRSISSVVMAATPPASLPWHWKNNAWCCNNTTRPVALNQVGTNASRDNYAREVHVNFNIISTHTVSDVFSHIYCAKIVCDRVTDAKNKNKYLPRRWRNVFFVSDSTINSFTLSFAKLSLILPCDRIF